MLCNSSHATRTGAYPFEVVDAPDGLHLLQLPHQRIWQRRVAIGLRRVGQHNNCQTGASCSTLRA